MKLLINDLNIAKDIIDLPNYLLIIQNKKYLYKLITNIQNDEEDFIKIVDGNWKKQKKVEYIDAITSLFDLEVNNKKNINFLYKQIKSYFRNDFTKMIDLLCEKLRELFSEVIISYQLELISDVSISDDDIIKLLGIKIDDTNIDLLEKIIKYIKTTFELRRISIFIFYGLSSLLSSSEINQLIKECNLLGVSLIDIETNDCEKINFDYKKIFDGDCCIIE